MYSNYPAAVFGSILGSLLPDIDHPRSIPGRLMFFISIPIYKFFGHRTITHSLLGMGIFYAVFQIAGVIDFFSQQFITGFFIGYLGHLLADSMTPAGIQWLYPYCKKLGLYTIFPKISFLKKSAVWGLIAFIYIQIAYYL